MWWNLLCNVIAPLCLKVLSQILQVKAMSYCFLFLVVGSDNSWHFFLALSLFLLKCFFITSFLWNTIPQSTTAQLKFNFVWTEFACILSSPICVKSWSHWSQWCEVKLSWLFLWTSSIFGDLNFLLQTIHAYSFGEWGILSLLAVWKWWRMIKVVPIYFTNWVSHLD